MFYPEKFTHISALPNKRHKPHAYGTVSVVRDIGTVQGLTDRRLWHIWLIILGCEFAVLQAPLLNGLPFDPFSFHQDGLAAPVIDIGGREIAQALVIALLVVVLDEGLDLSLEVARQVIVLQQDPVLEGLVPSLDLALGLGVIRRPTDMLHISLVEPGGQLTGDIAQPVVGQEPRLVNDRSLIAA